ncbi:MAG: hypothetical protein IJP29_07635 [Lachnospiraceae bacterium]|nr:hypothetical protein [Lachnospiraceae bacterium]
MMRLFGRKRSIAIMMMIIMLFTLIPVDLNWADTATMTTLEESAEDTTELVTEVVRETEMEDEVESVVSVSDGEIESTTTEAEMDLEENETVITGETTEAIAENATDNQIAKETQPLTPLVGENLDAQKEDSSNLLLDNDTFNLNSLTLEASYVDENNKTQTVALDSTDYVDIPMDADIYMYFRFMFNDGNQIEVGKEYTYIIPDEIRVDVNTVHDLLTENNTSIGTVHISDGKLVFVFNDNVKDQVNIPFFVQFDGGFSADSEEEMGENEISFPTATGSFDFKVNIEDSYQETEPTEPGELGVSKSGTKTTVNVNGVETPVIQWNVTFDLNGRDTLSADITDMLPDGLTYAKVDGYPAFSGGSGAGTVTSPSEDGAQTVSIRVDGIDTYYRTNVTFYTYYDDSVYDGVTLDNNNGVTVNNTVAVDEDGSTSSVTGSGSAYLSPKVLSKTGGELGSDGYIEWTVVLNPEGLDIGGATYTDTFGDYLGWSETENDSGATSNVTVRPSGTGMVETTKDGFTFTANSGVTDTITLTYKTHASNLRQDSYTNTGTLVDGTDINASVTASVEGHTWLTKSSIGDYNPVTKQLTWQIVVNPEHRNMNDDDDTTVDSVTIQDVFNIAGRNQNKMELVSMDVTKVEDVSGNDVTSTKTIDTSSALNGMIVIQDLGTDSAVVTVVTRVLDEANDLYDYQSWESKWSDGDWVSAMNQAKINWRGNTVTAEATKGLQYKVPDIITKSGNMSGDGTIDWKIYYKYQNLEQKSITISDTFADPELEFVEGSLYLRETTWPNATVEITPTLTANGFTFTIDETSSTELQNYLTKDFEVHYKTKQTDLNDADVSKDYTNSASTTVVYEGDVTVIDGAEATVTGEVGGTLDKTAAYQNGKDYVDWTVMINEGGYTLNATNPVIRDTLAEYFDYVVGSAKLYLVDGDTKTPVTNFTVQVVNNEMVVTLPDIEDETYELTFQTKFNVIASKLADVTITNEVAFEGSAYNKSVSSNEVKNVSFSSSSAGAYYEKQLRIMKVNSQGEPLAGAVFDLYYNGTYITTVTTGADGIAKFNGINSSAEGYTYTLRETTAPDGYVKPTQDYTVVIKDTDLIADGSGVRYHLAEIENVAISQEKQINFGIHKTDDKNFALVGAGFTVYSDAACTDAIATKATGENGMVSFTVTYDTSTDTVYYVKETTVPDRFKENARTYVVTIESNGRVTCKDDLGTSIDVLTLNSVANAFSVKNTEAKAKLVLTKKDVEDNTVVIPGATYTLYQDAQCSDPVDSKTSDSNGEMTFEGLTLGRTYYYRETEAPDGYLIDETVHSITVGTGTEHDDITVTADVEDERAIGLIRVIKTDDTAKANRLAGVTFQLFEADGTTPYYILADPNDSLSQVQYEVTTDSNGEAVFKDLPFGTYVVKESSGLEGYIADTSGKIVVVDDVDGNEITVINEQITFNLKVIKTDDSTPAKALEGVLFNVRNKATGALVATGETGVDGTVTFADLPYADYVVTEAKGLVGYTVAASQTVTTTEITADEITVEKTFVNTKQNASVRFMKRASDTNEYLAGAEFSVYNSKGELVTTVTSADGTGGTNLGEVVIEGLIYDTYTIKETKAPNKYQLSTKEWKVEVEDNIEYTILYDVYDSTGSSIIDNEAIPSSINYMTFDVVKRDDTTEEKPLQGALFALYKTIDGVQTELAQAYSDVNGKVHFYNIPVGEDNGKEVVYTIKEIKAPYGYVLDETNVNEYTWEELPGLQIDGSYVYGHEDMKEDNEFTNVPVLATYENTQILGSILVKKTGGLSSIVLQGAEFTLYKYNALTSAYEEYKLSDGSTYVVTTDANGLATFKDLPYGTYMVKETKAPKGYVLNVVNQKMVTIDSTNFPDNESSAISMAFIDAAINVSVNKFAIGGSTQLEGAVLELYEEGNTTDCLQTWTTTNNAQKLDNTKLEIGKTYYIHEKIAPNGYKMSEDVYFTINSDGTITYKSGVNGSISGNNVIMRDEPLSLSVKKDGLDTTTNPATTTENIAGASISIIDAETDKVLYTYTSTNSVQTIPTKDLKLSHEYIIHENSAPYGYALAEDIRIRVNEDGTISLVGTNGSVSGNTVTMVDEKYVNFYFAKRDAVTGEALAGAEFTIYEADGVTVAKDTNGVELQWTSTTTAKNVSLEPDKTYVFKEEKAPKGYELEAPITFKIVDAPDPNVDYIQVVSGSDYNLSANALTLTSRDAQINVKFVKWSETYQPLAGGTFELCKSDANGTIGEVLYTFNSTGATITLPNTYFELNGYYVIVEKEAPTNYLIADPIFFYIDNNGDARDADGNLIDSNVVIFIDGEKQMCFQKVDAATGTPLSGVNLMISSTEDADFVAQSWVTDGTNKYFGYSLFERNKKYILSEVATVKGYTYAANVEFMIDDNDVVYVNGVPQNTATVVMENTTFNMYIDKQDLDTKKPLAGATLAIKDASGNVLEQWVSDGTPHKVDASKLLVSKGEENVYTLEEIAAPELYALAQPIQFVVDATGVVKRVDGTEVSNNTIVMYDDYRGITFSKKNEKGGELSGVTITISSLEDAEFTPITFVTTNVPKNLSLDSFKRNVNYIMSETDVPNGYTYAEDVTFRIDDNDVVYVNGMAASDRTVTMINTKFNVFVAKMVEGEDTLLAGAKLSIVDEATGTVVYSWKTKEKVKKIPVNKLMASTETEKIIYVLKETSAPEGYEVAKEIRFYIASNGDVYVIDEGGNETLMKDDTITMYDTPSEDGDTGTKTTSKKTGDATPIKAIVMLFVLCLAGFVGLFFVRRRRNEQ